MRFNGLDLNLLVALQALLDERNISRAGTRLHLSQSAMSSSLARLRDYFGDELLTPSGRQMVLTPRAESLVQPVREVLMRIDSTIAAQPVFDPATATRDFKLLVSDLTISVFMPAFIERLYREAPGIRIELIALHEEPVALIERGDVDLLFFPSQFVSAEHPSQTIYEESYVCVTWDGNTNIRKSLTFKQYMAAGHVVAQFGGSRSPAFDSWFLERYGVARRVEVNAPALGSLPSLVIGTNRIATVHRRLAERDRKILPIKIWEPPIDIPKLTQVIQWNKYRSNDLALAWLRSCAIEVGKSI